MRRARATTLLATLVVLLAGCAPTPQATDDATRVGGAAVADSERPLAAVEPTATIDGDVVHVVVDGARWRLELLEAGPVDLQDVAMFDGPTTATAPAPGEQVGWVCVRATQLSGEVGAWMSDAVRIEVWASAQGPRYDDMTGFAYEPAGTALDVYAASGNSIGEPYERVCPIFVVPDDVDLSTIAFVPNGGAPAVLER